MKKIAITSTILFVFLIACKTSTTSTSENKLVVNFESKSNSNTKGTATFIEKKGQIIFSANITGLNPGVHAIHIHDKSDCSSSDGSSAGGHWNPTFKKHGKWGGMEFHKGDIGNFIADENGNGTITMTTNEWCLGCTDENKNILGKGLIVHQNQDDFISQPAGNAGARIACTGLIK